MIKALKQLFFAADDGAGGGGEGDSFVIMIDPQTDQEVKVPKDLEKFIEHVASRNRASGKAKAKKEIDEKSEKIEDLMNEVADLKGKVKNSGDGNKQVENIKSEYEKLIKEKDGLIEKLSKGAEESKNKYLDYRKRIDISAALSESGFVPYDLKDTIETLMRNAKTIESHNLTTGEPTGDVETMITLNIPDESGAVRPLELKAGEAVKKFFANPANEWRLKNTLNPGGGSTGGNMQGGATGAMIVSEDRFNQMSPKDRASFMEKGGQIK